MRSNTAAIVNPNTSITLSIESIEYRWLLISQSLISVKEKNSLPGITTDNYKALRGITELVVCSSEDLDSIILIEPRIDVCNSRMP
jgi:hypothetical protein